MYINLDRVFCPSQTFCDMETFHDGKWTVMWLTEMHLELCETNVIELIWKSLTIDA